MHDQWDPRGRIEHSVDPTQGEAEPDGVRVGQADHEARNGDRPPRIGEPAGEGIARGHQADDSRRPPGVADVEDLRREEAGAAVDQHDLPAEAPGERKAAVEVAPRAVAVHDRFGDQRYEWSRPGLEDGRVEARDLGRRGDLQQRLERRGHVRLRHRERGGRGRGRARHVGLVATVARGGDGEHSQRGRVLDRLREVVVEGGPVIGAERHVDDVDGVRRVSVSVRIHGEVHGLDQGDAAAGARHVRADLDRNQIGPGRDAAEAPGDVGHVRSVRGPIQGVGVGRQRTGGPVGAHEVEAIHDLGGGEGPRLDDRGVVRRVVGRIARPAEVRVGVVDAGVEDGDPDSRAVEALPVHGARPDVGHGLAQVQLVVAHRRHAQHARVPCDVGHGVGVDLEGHRVQRDLRARQHHEVGGRRAAALDEVRLLGEQRLLMRPSRRCVQSARPRHGRTLQAHQHLLHSVPAAPRARIDGSELRARGRDRSVELLRRDRRGQGATRPLARLRGRLRGAQHQPDARKRTQNQLRGSSPHLSCASHGLPSRSLRRPDASEVVTLDAATRND